MAAAPMRERSREMFRTSGTRTRRTNGSRRRRRPPARLVWREDPRNISLIIDPDPKLRTVRPCYDSDIDRIDGLRRRLDTLNSLQNLNPQGPWSPSSDLDANIQRSWQKVADDMFRENRDYVYFREFFTKHCLKAPFRADERRPVSRVYLLSLGERHIQDGSKDTVRHCGRNDQLSLTVGDSKSREGHSVEAAEPFDDIIDSSDDSDALIEDYLESHR